jgi:hypothetical protein
MRSVKRIEMAAGMAFMALYLSYYAATTAFYHIHTGCNGLISHSHPYIPSDADEPYAPAHRHSQEQCRSIALLADIVTSAVTAFCRPPAPPPGRVVHPPVARRAWHARLPLQRLRAPPAGRALHCRAILREGEDGVAARFHLHSPANTFFIT